MSAGNLTPLRSAALLRGPEAREVIVEPGKETHGINIDARPVSSGRPVLLQAGAGEMASAGGASVRAGSTATLFLVGENLVPGTFYSVTSGDGEVTIQQPEPQDFTIPPTAGRQCA